MQNSLLSMQNIHKTFAAEVPVVALKNVSFDLPNACFAAVVGPSGSGKTTLLNLASGLDSASSGKIIIAGQPISELNNRELSLFRLQHLGFVFQAYNLFLTLTVIENVEYTMLMQGVPASHARKQAQAALAAVGLADKANFFPQKLSGGQQQRVAVARAIACQPKIIFADEPTANLDAETSFKLIELFRTLNREQNISFLFSTHDNDLINSVNKVVRLRSGEVVH